ncbi:hypothetical protein Tco_1498650, partial [Tanacetum coccineum]
MLIRFKVETRKLYNELGAHKQINNDIPWAILGDSNVTLILKEHFNGSSVYSSDMMEFKDFIPNSGSKNKKAFRFSNFITSKEEFLPIVRNAWSKEFEGHKMLKIVKKLKLLKPKMNELSWKDDNVDVRVKILR